MNTRKLLIASAAALLPMTAVLAAEPPTSASSDPTANAVATLKDKIGKRAGVEVDEVRVTDSGTACIKYRVRDNVGGTSREHAVVRGDEVERSTLGNKQFEKAWSDNCLGPRGGMTPAQ
jgi:hypothetical protein